MNGKLSNTHFRLVFQVSKIVPLSMEEHNCTTLLDLITQISTWNGNTSWCQVPTWPEMMFSSCCSADLMRKLPLLGHTHYKHMCRHCCPTYTLTYASTSMRYTSAFVAVTWLEASHDNSHPDTRTMMQALIWHEPGRVHAISWCI